jgi:hypothetical protein
MPLVAFPSPHSPGLEDNKVLPLSLQFWIHNPIQGCTILSAAEFSQISCSRDLLGTRDGALGLSMWPTTGQHIGTQVPWHKMEGRKALKSWEASKNCRK